MKTFARLHFYCESTVKAETEGGSRGPQGTQNLTGPQPSQNLTEGPERCEGEEGEEARRVRARH